VGKREGGDNVASFVALQQETEMDYGRQAVSMPLLEFVALVEYGNSRICARLATEYALPSRCSSWLVSRRYIFAIIQ